MDINNQSLRAHLLSFDPVFKTQTGNNRGPASTKPYKDNTGFHPQEDGSVILTMKAPNAGRVDLRYCIGDGINSIPGDYKPEGRGDAINVTIPMEKNADGLWSAHINPGPGTHDVYFSVDGVNAINTELPWGYDGFGVRNFIDLPDDPLYLLQDVPHGYIARRMYKSSVTGRTRVCWVYTPPMYDESSERYPVLYLQHGGGESEVCWFQSGKADIMMDNMIAAGLVKPMIIVCNCGYAHKPAGEPEMFCDCDIDKVIANDCIPFIDSHYRTIPEREYRAAAGLSMGGTHARRMVYRHTDLFANIAMFSCGTGLPVNDPEGDKKMAELYADAELFNSTMKLCYITVGDADKIYEHTAPVARELIDKGFNIIFKSYRGRHEWNVWRPSFRDYAQMLWR